MYSSSSDMHMHAVRDGGSSSSGGGVMLQRFDVDARALLLMQEMEDMKQLLKVERDARMALERKVAVLLHWKDSCDSDVQDCKGRVDTMDHKLQLDIQRLSSKMADERSKLTTGKLPATCV
jgi:hypothetical protein